MMRRSATIPTGALARLAILGVLVSGLVVASGVPALGDKRDRQERRAAREAERRGEYDIPTKYWREGPVRYLMEREEDMAYRAIRDREAQAQFIQRFWAARDPDPTTPDNKFRELFYRRVNEANQLFHESTKPGWMTDRGKIYILLGPPDELNRLSVRQVFPDVIEWTYRNPPPGTSLAPISIVRFVRDRGGEYRLSTSLRMSGNETSLSLALQVQAMQMKSLPERHQILDAIVSEAPLREAAPFRTHSEFFRAANGDTFSVLTLGVKENLIAEGRDAPGGGPSAPPPPPASPSAPGGSRYEIITRMIGDGPDGPTYDLVGADALRAGVGGAARDREGYLLFQGGSNVEPGKYTVYYGVIDLGTGRIHSFQEEMDVPEFHYDRMAVSSITLASRLERMPSPMPPGLSRTNSLGGLRAVPRPDDLYLEEEDLIIYFRISGVSTDPIEGRPDFDLTYRFFASRQSGEDGEPLFAPMGNPIQLLHLHDLSQGFTFPLTGWAPAIYRLQVEATDRLSGRRASNHVQFRIP